MTGYLFYPSKGCEVWVLQCVEPSVPNSPPERMWGRCVRYTVDTYPSILCFCPLCLAAQASSCSQPDPRMAPSASSRQTPTLCSRTTSLALRQVHGPLLMLLSSCCRSSQLPCTARRVGKGAGCPDRSWKDKQSDGFLRLTLI